MNSIPTSTGKHTEDELRVTFPLCTPIVADTAELLAAARHLAAARSTLNSHVVSLQLAEKSLLGTYDRPSDMMSAGPALVALYQGRRSLSRCMATMESLAHQLTRAAQNYQEVEESLWHKFRSRVSNSFTWWQQNYDTWMPLPTDVYLAPSYRFVDWMAEAQLGRSIQFPVNTLLNPRMTMAMLFSGGVIKFSQLRRLSPAAWFQIIPDHLTSAHGLLKAVSPVTDPQTSGLNRADSARFVQAFSRVLSPGKDPIGRAARGTARRVDDVYSAVKLRQVRVHQLPERPGDSQWPPIRTFADSIAVMEELNISQGAHAGELRIDKVTSAEGNVAWQVFIPGAQGLSPTRVHSLLHTPRALDGDLTPTAGMVLTAMRQVGVQKGQPVVMVGHSLGGMTGNSLANHQRVRAEFDVPLVITVGSPLDRQPVRPDTQLIAFEHEEDFVTGLDGVELQARANVTTISRELHASSIPAEAAGRGPYHYHDYPTYIRTAALADADLRLVDARTLLEEIIPDGNVQTYRFQGSMSP